MVAASGQIPASPKTLNERFSAIRGRSLQLCQSLEAEDFVVQSMPDVSPTKWHLAHVTWFFETFVLQPHASNYRCFDERFAYLFNSYYYTAGQMHGRAVRGLLTRPTVAGVLAYRQHVDDAMQQFLANCDDTTTLAIVELGLHHEQQHQELLLTDIKHVLSVNPLQPAMLQHPPSRNPSNAIELAFENVTGGVVRIGADPDADAFCYDNETPQHEVLLRDHAIANRAVTNAEYLEFIEDGGYQESALWLSDGWAAIQQHGWQAPLYWNETKTHAFTLAGPQEIDEQAPVAHVSFYEADAFARWAGLRLPSEAEWEYHAATQPLSGNFAEDQHWQPIAGGTGWFGDVWEWTASSYAPYPGFRPLAGSLGEYNGKFMCNQMVVRGGSCASAASHLRATYRSFFYPDARWQFLGLRLAKDL
ncbi:MAG: ergothioneine biosynthesis protein EgtB [Woeseiaceae bacterium]